MLSRRSERALTLLITALGFALRLYALGRDSFWLDEAGQALAVLQPDWADMLAIERSHAMAMPLDYVMARLLSPLGPAEFVLRFPAALWGTLSLPLMVALGRRVAGRPAAVLAAFFLAVSPLFVRYSQELRFYSALVALFLLSTLLLVEAFRRRSHAGWLGYALVAALGAYFHPYVLLSAAAGAVFALLPGRVTGITGRTRLYFALACAAAGLLFLPGYLLFGAHQEYAFDLLEWGGTLGTITRHGLDWTGLGGASGALAQAAYWSGVIFALIGTTVALTRWRRTAWLIALVGGIALSVAAIILASLFKDYWYLSRQLLPLAALVALLSAFGVVQAAQAVAVQLHLSVRRATAIAALLAALLVGAAAGQALAAHYVLPRSLAREAAAVLAEPFARGEPILVMPNFDRQLYAFYLAPPGDFDATMDRLSPVDWAELPATLPAAGLPVHLVARGGLSDEQRAALAGWGFAPVWGPLPARDGVLELFIRPALIGD